MQYKILYSDENYLHTASSELVSKVEEAIKNGWKPLGSVSVTSTKSGYATYYTLCQAMIKYDE
ncbi:MAG: DUF1737 domain-containing protein [Clostridia bacterium]|nr:DUF1737 domain-containing protein [Clostridia bacterium]